MEQIIRIREKFQDDQFEFSKHAADRLILRYITVKEVRDAIRSGVIIEDYTTDKYGPSCLILGFTGDGRPLHIQCSYATRSLVKVITVYEPDPEEWIAFKERNT